MLSFEHASALDRLEHGSQLNALSRVARELVAAGLAFVDFGYLRITETGRRELRRRMGVSDGNVSGLADHGIVDPARFPMGKPPELPMDKPPEFVLASEEFISSLEEAVVPLDQMQRALRAAGVASGITNVWVDEKWVEAFVEAFLDAKT